MNIYLIHIGQRTDGNLLVGWSGRQEIIAKFNIKKPKLNMSHFAQKVSVNSIIARRLERAQTEIMYE